ncbi:MAG TPA: hypothetical protein VNH20_08535 [Candidatus Dormibacteraeota bacterium]|nr:hypothetical protein [Candidatus Dormibacteraeota bacterium]
MARRSRANRLAARQAAQGATEPAVPASFKAERASSVDLSQQLRAWSLTAARISLGLVLLWFGLHELFQPSLWTGYVPVISQTSHLAVALVLVHGWMLTVLGIALLLGIAPQLVAGISALLLLEIVFSLTFSGGLSDIVARDLGVFGLAVAVFAGNHQKLVLRG